MIKKILKIVVNVLLVVSFSSYFAYKTITCRVIVSGPSMNPTLEDLDYGVMKTSSKTKKNIKRFDIIVADAIVNGKLETVIKRVIGLPGEKISINQVTGELTVDDKIIVQDFLDNSYVRKTCNNSHGVACGKEYHIPENEYYVLGDNRSNSTDSEHGLGKIEKKAIIGVLWYIDAKCGSYDEENNVCKDKTKTEIRYFLGGE